MKFQFVYLTQPLQGAAVQFEQDAVILGRSPDADLTVDEGHVSGKHARVFTRDNRVFVEDLGSTNGTFVNGRRITAATPLTSGDTLQLGTVVKLRFLPLTGDDFADKTIIGAPEELPAHPQPYPRVFPEPAPPPRKKKSFPVWVIIVLGIVILACVGVLVLGGGGYFFLNMFNSPEKQTAQAMTQSVIETQQAAVAQTQMAQTQAPMATATAEAALAMEATSQAGTAQAQAQATAMAEASATAQAGLTATAQAEADAALASQYWTYIQGNMDPAFLVYGPESGTIIQTDDENVDGTMAGVDLLNGVVTVDFYPPYSPDEADWDVGIFFRDLGTNDEYRVIIDSTGQFVVNDRQGEDNNYLVQKSIDMIHLGPNEKNQMVLLINGDVGVFFLNGEFVAEIDLSRRMQSGDIAVVTNIQVGFVIDGSEVYYENFKIYTLVQ
jgi:flagellar basal body-associated protein FliL